MITCAWRELSISCRSAVPPSTVPFAAENQCRKDSQCLAHPRPLVPPYTMLPWSLAKALPPPQRLDFSSQCSFCKFLIQQCSHILHYDSSEAFISLSGAVERYATPRHSRVSSALLNQPCLSVILWPN